MINNLLYFSYIYIIILIRSIFPLFWIWNNYIEIKYKYMTILVYHSIYLIFQLCIFLLIIKWIKKIHPTRKKAFKIKGTVDIYIFLVLILYIIIDYKQIPIFMSKGSDSLVELVETSKIKIWIIYSLLNIAKIYSLTRYIYYEKKLSLINALIISILPGKKALVLFLIMNYYFIKYLYYKNTLQIKKIYGILFLLLGSFYIVIIYGRTNEVVENDILKIFEIFKITYYSMTSYLSQMFVANGISYSSEYSEMLGRYKILVYFFNSFTKILFGLGIEKSIGPYLSYKLYGNNFPNGVNPTLFFELYYIYDSLISLFILIIIVVLLVIALKLTIKSILRYRVKNLFICSLYLVLFFEEIGIFFDSLNSIRSMFLPLLLLISLKLFCKKGEQ